MSQLNLLIVWTCNLRTIAIGSAVRAQCDDRRRHRAHRWQTECSEVVLARLTLAANGRVLDDVECIVIKCRSLCRKTWGYLNQNRTGLGQS